jgi:3',5'-cyclic AMP phosphodiesterase CpdA
VTIDANIGQYYHDYIGSYKGRYGPGATSNRFFPVLGNHDWDVAGARPYLDYFTLPGNERYYTFTWGPVEFFMLDSALDEPDGTRPTSAQARWFRERCGQSRARWKVVVMHHPPFSSGLHGSSPWMQWPYREWGADLVLAGHDHNYERLLIDGFPYLINGLGGGARYEPGRPRLAGSAFFYNLNHGALRVEVDARQMTLEFVSRAGATIDTLRLHPRGAASSASIAT